MASNALSLYQYGWVVHCEHFQCSEAYSCAGLETLRKACGGRFALRLRFGVLDS